MAVAVAAVAVLLAVSGPAAAPGLASTTSYAVTATIPVGDLPLGVGVDPSVGTAYVANNGDGTVSVIDGATGTVTAAIPVGFGPFGVGVDPSTHTVYVASENDDTVSVIDGATGTVTATIAVGAEPSGVGVDPPPTPPM